MRIMFVTCLEDVLGYGVLKTQVLELLYEIKEQRKNIEIHLLAIVRVNYYRQNREEARKFGEELRKRGIIFHFVPVVFPAGKFYLNTWERIVFMPQAIFWLKYFVLRYRINIVQGRSYLSTYVAVWIARIFPWIRVMFDTRALYVDEGIVVGKWKAGDKEEKKWRGIERSLIERSDVTISVSYPQEEYYRQFSETILTIPNCVNMERFKFDEKVREEMRRQLKVEDRLVLVHIGSIYNWYDPKFIVKYMTELRKLTDRAYLLIITQSDTKEIMKLLEREGISKDNYKIVIDPKNVEELALAGDWGLLLLKNNSASRITHTVKFSEYMASGLSTVTFDYVGGAKYWIEKGGCGLLIGEEIKLSREHLEKLKKGREMSKDCREMAEKYFSTKACARVYIKAYENVLEGK